jgi:hypothetical protein
LSPKVLEPRAGPFSLTFDRGELRFLRGNLGEQLLSGRT